MSGDDSHVPYHTDVGFTISLLVKECLVSSQSFSNRLACLNVKANYGRIAICCVYARYNGHDLTWRRDFFHNINNYVRSISVHGPKLTYGDLNARLHFRTAAEHSIIGPHVFGDSSSSVSASNNRVLLMEVCNNLNL